MKRVYLVEAAAGLIVVPAWAVPPARPCLSVPDTLGAAGRGRAVQVGPLSLSAQRTGLTVRHRGAHERVGETGKLTAAYDDALGRVLPGGSRSRTRGRSQ
jgi:hypothetical protein